MTILALLYLVALCAMVYLKHRDACLESERDMYFYYMHRMNSAYRRRATTDFKEAMRAEELFLYRGQS